MKKNNFCYKKNEWYFEDYVPHDEGGRVVGLKIKKKLYSGKSIYQKIDFYDTYSFGKILTLDGILQTSEKDEFVYHEMMCHIPMFLHKNPKKVLIIGGGDGGSLEEILKHNVEEVKMVEIDEKVVELSKKYLPSISKNAFKDKRAELIIGDGKAFIEKNINAFDVIVLDLSDPEGPAKELISLDFYKNVKKCLKDGGVLSIQSGSFSTQPKLVSTIYNRIKKVFPFYEIHRGVVFSYQAGEFSFIIASKENINSIKKNQLEKRFKKSKLNLKYFSPDMYFSSKVLPKFIKETL
jgi:spermidine synthase